MDESREKVVWTPLKIIQWAVPFLAQKGIPNPRLDAELLMAHALKLDRLKVYLQFDRPLDPQELTVIREFLKRRSRHEPIQYITGEREFFGISFKVGPGVLIPRPETELLVEKALEHLKGLPEDKRIVLDLGTGSGCIALSIAKNIVCKVWAVDISEKALEIARFNSQNLGLTHIQWRQGHWFKALNKEDPSQFGLIVSNPPYIPFSENGEMAPEIKDFEPPEALFADNQGMKAYEELGEGLKNCLFNGGAVLLEIHSQSYEKASALFKADFGRQTLFRDLQGLPRVIRLDP
jgi:release factor glutamine methyltransferase